MQLSMQMQKGSKADGTFGYMTEEQFEQLKTVILWSRQVIGGRLAMQATPWVILLN